MCRMMSVHPSGYYAWRSAPVSPRQKEDQRFTGLIKQFWLESGGVYGYRKITDDLRDVGETCGKHRVHRLMRLEGLRSQTGYRRRPGQRHGRPSVVAPNHVQQQFDVAEPNRVWVTDITYIPPMRAGCIWPWCSIFSRAKWSAGPCSRAWIGSWRSTRC
jgi:putative transposase